MSPKTALLAAVTLVLSPVFAAPALAEIEIRDAYARAAAPTSKSGAAFMEIANTGAEDDRLIAASSEVAARVELHTHKETGDGIMQMMQVEDGFPVPAGEVHALQRGGDHVMFMGLSVPMNDGAVVTLILTFEKAGEMEIEVPVDLSR